MQEMAFLSAFIEDNWTSLALQKDGKLKTPLTLEVKCISGQKDIAIF